VTDLPAEFEAQLRAVTRLEEQLRKSNGRDASGELAKAVRRELSEMLTNNTNIRNVLNELAAEAGAGANVDALNPLDWLFRSVARRAAANVWF
jgi:hypothetical protein